MDKCNKVIKSEIAEIVLKRYLVPGKTVSPFDVSDALDELNSIPAEDVVPAKHGEWASPEPQCEYYYCTNCQVGRTIFGKLYRYCPYCGAKMEE